MIDGEAENAEPRRVWLANVAEWASVAVALAAVAFVTLNHNLGGRVGERIGGVVMVVIGLLGIAAAGLQRERRRALLPGIVDSLGFVVAGIGLLLPTRVGSILFYVGAGTAIVAQLRESQLG